MTQDLPVAKSSRFVGTGISVTPYLFVGLWVFGFIAFTLGPLIFSLYTSFFDWPLIGEHRFIGLENYRYMFAEDDDFWWSLYVTLKFAAMYVPLNMIAALGLALLLNKPLFGQGLFRAAFYLPSVLSGVALVTIWAWILSTDYGVLNYVLSLAGVGPVNWLGSPDWAPFSIVITSVWTVGGTMLVFLAGLKGIPQELYEASELAGVIGLNRFWKVTIPLLSPIILFNLVTTLINAFQQLTLALLLTKGGPVKSTYMLAMYIYDNAFKHHDMGYASAMTWVMFFVIMILTAIVMKFSSLWVFYETEVKKGGGAK